MSRKLLKLLIILIFYKFIVFVDNCIFGVILFSSNTMKNKKLKNLFVRGNRFAMFALFAALMDACNKNADPRVYISNKDGFVYLIVLLVVCFGGPLAIGLIDEAHNNNTKQH